MPPPQYPSAIELAKLLKHRDKNAFDYLYDTYAPSLYGVIIKLVKDKDLAGQILKKAFIQIWNDSSTFDYTKQSLFIWMYSITYKAAKAELTNAANSEVNAMN